MLINKILPPQDYLGDIKSNFYRQVGLLQEMCLQSMKLTFLQSQIIADNMVTLVAGLQLEQLLARSDVTCSNAISRLHRRSS